MDRPDYCAFALNVSCFRSSPVVTFSTQSRQGAKTQGVNLSFQPFNIHLAGGRVGAGRRPRRGKLFASRMSWPTFRIFSSNGSRASFCRISSFITHTNNRFGSLRIHPAKSVARGRITIRRRPGGAGFRRCSPGGRWGSARHSPIPCAACDCSLSYWSGRACAARPPPQ